MATNISTNRTIADNQCIKIKKTSVSSLPTTITDDRLIPGYQCIKCELSNPSAQVEDWTVDTSTIGEATITGTINETTDITLYLEYLDPERHRNMAISKIPSAEYIICENIVSSAYQYNVGNNEYDYGEPNWFKIDGYTMILAIGFVYSGAINCTNFTPTKVNYHSTESLVLPLKAVCIYKKN